MIFHKILLTNFIKLKAKTEYTQWFLHKTKNIMHKLILFLLAFKWFKRLYELFAGYIAALDLYKSVLNNLIVMTVDT